MKRVHFTFEEGEPIRSVEHFLSEIRHADGPASFRLCFRGHGEPITALVPSIGRKHHYLDRAITFDARQERSLLMHFRRYAYEHFGRVPTEWETLFLARHHGLPTRLLDWTFNPLVALYFAAFYQSEEVVASAKRASRTQRLDVDGTVWAIEIRRNVTELDVFQTRRSPLKTPGVKLVYPFNPTPRITAQSGVFTLHGDPWTDLVERAGKLYAARDLDIARLMRWKVPSAAKTGIVLELERLAINSRTLFPDFDGLARGLWQTEIIRRCFESETVRHRGRLGPNSRHGCC